MKRPAPTLAHLKAMHAKMDDDTTNTHSQQPADTQEQLLQMALSLAGYVNETKTGFETYREETKALQALLANQMEAILADLQRGSALQERLITDANALKRAEALIAQVVRQHQAVYNRLTNPLLGHQPEQESDQISQSTRSLGR